jgi:hypothetical protein
VAEVVSVVVEGDQARRVRQTSAYLRQRLEETGEYRLKWRRRAELGQGKKLNVDAVARVLADYLTNQGDGVAVSHRSINDTIKRALDGSTLTAKTLNAFIGAFSMTDLHAERLLRLLDGTADNVVIGELAPAPALPKARYQTIMLREFHYVGADGRPSHHRTVQEICALVEGFTTHQYRFDTNEAVVERVLGGTPSELSGDIWAVDLRLPRMLRAGDSASMEYVTRFRYSRPVDPCLRRVAHQRVENLSLRVEFHPQKLPRAVWWAEWTDYREPGARIDRHELLELDAEHAVERRLDILERAVVGFVWEFDVGVRGA